MSGETEIPVVVLEGQEGRVALSVVGYEFPLMAASGHCDYDANWLVVRGVVSCERGNWEFVFPCLLTWELELLGAWLASLPHPERLSIGFIEPLLSFAWSEPTLTVTLGHEALPAWMDRDSRIEGGVALTFPFGCARASACVAVVGQMLALYPRR